MRAMTWGLMAALTALAAGSAQAQMTTPQFSGSLGYEQKDGFRHLGAVQLRGTARFGRYFGVEGEALKGVDSDTYNLPTSPPQAFRSKLRYELGAYAVAYAPVRPNADLFARVGYSESWFGLRYTGSVNGPVSYHQNEEAWNYGVGGQYFFDGRNGVRVDYTRQDFRDLPNADVWSVAYTRKF